MATVKKAVKKTSKPKEPTLLEMVQKGLANCKEQLGHYEKHVESCKKEIAGCEALIVDIKAGNVTDSAKMWLESHFSRC